MTTHSVVSEPRLLVATHLYLPESAGIEFMISMVMTPSVCVMGYLSVSSSLPPLNHLICEEKMHFFVISSRLSLKCAHSDGFDKGM